MNDDPYFEHVDEDGDRLVIWRATDHRSAIYLDTSPDSTSPTVRVRPDRFPVLVRAMYQGCGLTVPELPEIHDPELVRTLASDLHYQLHGTSPAAEPPSNYTAAAHGLLAHGWRKSC